MTKYRNLTMNEQLWKEVLDIYENSFGIPNRVVESLASYDILYLCCTGLSNETISTTLDIDINTVSEVLKEKLNFIGWYKDLDISPLYVYNSVNGVKDLYIASVMTVKGLIDKVFVSKSYTICRKFERIEKEINKYYD